MSFFARFIVLLKKKTTRRFPCCLVLFFFFLRIFVIFFNEINIFPKIVWRDFVDFSVVGFYFVLLIVWIFIIIRKSWILFVGIFILWIICTVVNGIRISIHKGINTFFLSLRCYFFIVTFFKSNDFFINFIYSIP